MRCVWNIDCSDNFSFLSILFRFKDFFVLQIINLSEVLSMKMGHLPWTWLQQHVRLVNLKSSKVFIFSQMKSKDRYFNGNARRKGNNSKPLHLKRHAWMIQEPPAVKTTPSIYTLLHYNFWGRSCSSDLQLPYSSLHIHTGQLFPFICPHGFSSALAELCLTVSCCDFRGGRESRVAPI